MSYPEMLMWNEVLKNKAGSFSTAVNVAGAAASYGGFAVMQPISLKRLLFFVTVQVTAGTTAPVVNWVSAPTYASSSGAVTLGTLTIPNGSAVGTVVYKDISDSTRVQAGYELTLNLQTQAADGGTAAGSGWMGMIWEPSPDADANNTKLVKSV
jgi:hypothetical protein